MEQNDDGATERSFDRGAQTTKVGQQFELIVGIGESEPYRLLEKLAAEMVRAIQVRWPKVIVDIELRKLHPPCPGNPAFTAVRLRSEQ